jgi:hypothetical protein
VYIGDEFSKVIVAFSAEDCSVGLARDEVGLAREEVEKFPDAVVVF